MKLIEVVGICLYECDCGQRFVTNTRAMEKGVRFYCPRCENCINIYPGSVMLPTVKLAPKPVESDGAEYVVHNPALTLDEYKKKIARFIITGKKPPFTERNRLIIDYGDKTAEVSMLAAALKQLGLTEEKVIEKIKEAIQLDYVYEDKILQYIMQDL